MIRAVVDVNVLLSAILGPLGFSRRVLLAWEANRSVAIASEGIYTELEQKLALPRISRRFNVRNPDDAIWLQGLLRTQAELILVPLADRPHVTGDPEDDYVLATGRLARADYLVTGDHGLLALEQYATMQIVTPRQFMELLDSRSSSAD
ncbi:MAG: putative toxin-antitoxin system toxin component, PIN family [Chloroflexi bacterium]|nr:putative toxin-antitoxin system toxin component, PIN family [Chloroflexota bacterium]